MAPRIMRLLGATASFPRTLPGQSIGAPNARLVAARKLRRDIVFLVIDVSFPFLLVQRVPQGRAELLFSVPLKFDFGVVHKFDDLVASRLRFPGMHLEGDMA